MQHIFEILLDDEKRRIYDETGLDPDSDDACFGHLSPEDILRFCRRHLGQVTEERIVEFEVGGTKKPTPRKGEEGGAKDVSI